MKGLIQIPLLILLLIGTGAGVYLVQQKTHFLPQAFSGKEIINILFNQSTATTSAAQKFTYQFSQPASSTNRPDNPTLSAFQRLLQRGARMLPNPSPTTTTSKSNAVPAYSAKPTTIPSPTPLLTTNSSVVNSTCDVNALAKPLDPNSYFDNILTIQLGYSAIYNGNKYVNGARWDFDGNDSWDTDTTLANGSIAHTFPGNGSYTVKLQLTMSDGEITPVCFKTVIIPMGIAIRLTGQVYTDANCNNIIDNGETGFSGMQISIMNPDGLVYDTVISDTNGNYTFSRAIPPNQSLTVQPSPLDHNLVFQPPAVTLSQNNSNATLNISHCQPPTPTPKCIPRPACLDLPYPCMMPEPEEGWCS